MSRGKSNKASSSFNKEDRQLLQNMNKAVKGLKEELKSLREELNKSKKDLKATKVENQRLKQALNLSNSNQIKSNKFILCGHERCQQVKQTKKNNINKAYFSIIIKKFRLLTTSNDRPT